MKRPLIIERRRSVPVHASSPTWPTSDESQLLPAPVAAALDTIVKEMRDVPRDCLYDRAELVHWLNRMARRVEGVATMKAPTPPRDPRRPTVLAGASIRALTIHQQAEAVFSSGPTPNSKPVERRTVSKRISRAVPIEIRKAGQMDFGV